MTRYYVNFKDKSRRPVEVWAKNVWEAWTVFKEKYPDASQKRSDYIIL